MTIRRRVTFLQRGGDVAAAANGVLYLSSGLVLDADTGQTSRAALTPGPMAALVVGDGRIGIVSQQNVRHCELFGIAGY